MNLLSRIFVFAAAMALSLSSVHAEHHLSVHYKGKAGPGKGKHVVLVSGDEEYRSEECLPMLGRILADHHGFDCTVLFLSLIHI